MELLYYMKEMIINPFAAVSTAKGLRFHGEVGYVVEEEVKGFPDIFGAHLKLFRTHMQWSGSNKRQKRKP